MERWTTADLRAALVGLVGFVGHGACGSVAVRAEQSWDTSGVPRLVNPRVSMPRLVDAAIAAFGTRLRVALLRRLSEAGPQTPVELLEHVGLTSRTTVFANLDALESIGVVHADLPPGQRQGRVYRYTVDTARLAKLRDALDAYLGLPPRVDTGQDD